VVAPGEAASHHPLIGESLGEDQVHAVVSLVVVRPAAPNVAGRNGHTWLQLIDRRRVGCPVRKRAGDRLVLEVIRRGHASGRAEKLIFELAVGVYDTDREGREELVIDARDDLVRPWGTKARSKALRRNHRSRVGWIVPA